MKLVNPWTRPVEGASADVLSGSVIQTQRFAAGYGRLAPICINVLNLLDEGRERLAASCGHTCKVIASKEEVELKEALRMPKAGLTTWVWANAKCVCG